MNQMSAAAGPRPAVTISARKSRSLHVALVRLFLLAAVVSLDGAPAGVAVGGVEVSPSPTDFSGDEHAYDDGAAVGNRNGDDDDDGDRQLVRLPHSFDPPPDVASSTVSFGGGGGGGDDDGRRESFGGRNDREVYHLQPSSLVNYDVIAAADVDDENESVDGDYLERLSPQFPYLSGAVGGGDPDVDFDSTDAAGPRRDKRLYFWEPMGLRFNFFRQQQGRSKDGVGGGGGVSLQGSSGPTYAASTSSSSGSSGGAAGNNPNRKKELPKKFYTDLRNYLWATNQIQQQQQQRGSSSSSGMPRPEYRRAGGGGSSSDSAPDVTKQPMAHLQLKKLQQAANALKAKPSKYLSFPLHFYRFMYTPGK